MLKIEGLVKRYGGGFRKSAHVAVDHVDLTIARGDALGLIGQSGSGKSTLARLIMGLENPSAGDIAWDGKSLSRFSTQDWNRFRAKAQIVFQDPASAFNPRLKLMAAFMPPLRNLAGMDTQAAREKARALVAEVGLAPDLLDRHPHALSGGQLQRVAIARALAPDPDFLLLDESVSALDVSVQAQVLHLIDRLRRDRELTLLFVTHDLAVVSLLCERLAVMQNGKLVEEGETAQLLRDPRVQYTRSLLDAAPSL